MKAMGPRLKDTEAQLAGACDNIARLAHWRQCYGDLLELKADWEKQNNGRIGIVVNEDYSIRDGMNHKQVYMVQDKFVPRGLYTCSHYAPGSPREVMMVHLFSGPVDIEALEADHARQFAERHDVDVERVRVQRSLEDCGQTLHVLFVVPNWGDVETDSRPELVRYSPVPEAVFRRALEEIWKKGPPLGPTINDQ